MSRFWTFNVQKSTEKPIKKYLSPFFNIIYDTEKKTVGIHKSFFMHCLCNGLLLMKLSSKKARNLNCKFFNNELKTLCLTQFSPDFVILGLKIYVGLSFTHTKKHWNFKLRLLFYCWWNVVTFIGHPVFLALFVLCNFYQ